MPSLDAGIRKVDIKVEVVGVVYKTIIVRAMMGDEILAQYMIEDADDAAIAEALSMMEEE